MEIRINEDELQNYVENCVNQKIDKLIDEIIKERVQKALFDRVDSIFSNYGNDIKCCIDKHVQKIVQERIELDSKSFDRAVKRLSSQLAMDLKNSILESVAYRLMPDTEEDDEE